jgi:hypothetical protein
MVHLALGVLAFLFLAWCSCFVVIAVLYVVGMVVVAVLRVLLWPAEVFCQFRANRKRAP